VDGIARDFLAACQSIVVKCSSLMRGATIANFALTMKAKFHSRTFAVFSWLSLACVSIVAACGDAESPVRDADAGRDAASTPVPEASGEERNNDVKGGDHDVMQPPAIEDAPADRQVPPHRPSTGACPAERGPGNSSSVDASYLDGGGSCRRDADCTDGQNGRCVATGSPCCGTRYVCSYDACSSDGDCGRGMVCICRTPATDSWATFCAPAGNCSTDGDCGSPGYCSLSLERRCPLSSGLAYFCHTPDDLCTTDDDCPDPHNCVYDTGAHHWACAPVRFCADASASTGR
jgi:hypothetical protein